MLCEWKLYFSNGSLSFMMPGLKVKATTSVKTYQARASSHCAHKHSETHNHAQTQSKQMCIPVYIHNSMETHAYLHSQINRSTGEHTLLYWMQTEQCRVPKCFLFVPHSGYDLLSPKSLLVLFFLSSKINLQNIQAAIFLILSGTDWIYKQKHCWQLIISCVMLQKQHICCSLVYVLSAHSKIARKKHSNFWV